MKKFTALSAAMLAVVLIASTATAQRVQNVRSLEEAAPERRVPGERPVGEGSGEMMEGPVYPPTFENEQTQPEINEGSEDNVDINEWDDGNGNGGASQGGK